MNKKEAHNFEEATVSATTRKVVSIVCIIIFITVMLLIGIFIGIPLFEHFGDREGFREWIGGYGAYGPVVCVGLMVLQIVVAIIPGGAFEVGAGYAFGTVPATIYCMLGSVIGSIIVFGFVKLIGVKLVEALFPLEKLRSLTFLHEKDKRNIITFIVFAIPGTPKDMLSYFMGLTEMDIISWVLISNIARFPAVLISTMSGDAVGKGNYGAAVAIAVVMVVGAVIGSICYERLSKRKNKNENKKTQSENNK